MRLYGSAPSLSSDTASLVTSSTYVRSSHLSFTVLFLVLQTFVVVNITF